MWKKVRDRQRVSSAQRYDEATKETQKCFSETTIILHLRCAELNVAMKEKGKRALHEQHSPYVDRLLL